MDLYFIALIPDKELRERVSAVKERMKADFNASHALRSPAHITLQMPFKRDSRDESAMSAALKKFARKERFFTIELDGFGCFAPRVIFIKIRDHVAVRSLHGRLKAMLAEELGFSDGELMNDVKPHLTVATRDLTKEAFNEAWNELKHEDFSGSFAVQSLFLLKHNGRHWDILLECPFDKL
jgi:2'-5' RNA ligase